MKSLGMASDKQCMRHKVEYACGIGLDEEFEKF